MTPLGQFLKSLDWSQLF